VGIGDSIKSAVDGVRDTLGTPCTLTRDDGSVVDVGLASFAELTPSQAQSVLGIDYEDEIGTPWAMIEIGAGFDAKENEKLTMGGRAWIIRRPMAARASAVEIAQRCLCVGKLV